MSTLFTTIPSPIENPTSPRRYSFFIGLKKVRINNGKEKNWRKALFNEIKKRTISFGASRNQNEIKTKGSLR